MLIFQLYNLMIRAILAYILFSLYLVFCLFYHQFCALYLCFYLIGDVQVKKAKKKQERTKKAKDGENVGACRSTRMSCRSMPCNHIKQRAASRNRLNLCRGTRKMVYLLIFRVMLQHDYSCYIMLQHDGLDFSCIFGK